MYTQDYINVYIKSSATITIIKIATKVLYLFIHFTYGAHGLPASSNMHLFMLLALKAWELIFFAFQFQSLITF